MKKMDDETKAAIRRFVESVLSGEEMIVCCVTVGDRGMGFCFGTDNNEAIERIIEKMRKALDQEPTSIITTDNLPPRFN